ncbi:MAG: hypothetical protein HY710_05720 [Candidatus Latescibacteria bacterium]|nr:hypothetical protein [Candidatus Latescibacterota bacterium]
MDLERLITLIVKTVVEELVRQGVIQGTTPAAPASRPMTEKGKRRVVTARMVLDAAAAGRSTLDVPVGSLITPLARDTAKEKGIAIRIGSE